jgi:hypothetical protein
VDARLVAFGTIEIGGHRYDHDVVIEHGQVRKRKKRPSKAYREVFGHTPVSIDEAIPWSAPRLIIGTGASGAMPIMPDVLDEARRRGVDVVMRPTAAACEALAAEDGENVAAILHVTC